MRLLDTNRKLEKAGSGRYLITGLSLAPASESGYNVCQFSTVECRTGCLATSGKWSGPGEQGDRVRAARIRRTRLFFEQRDRFTEQLDGELGSHYRRAERLGLIPALRPNVYADLPWERIPLPWPDGEYSTLIERWAERVIIYDYSKWPYRLRPGVPGYHLCYSATGENTADILEALEAGRTAAVVYDLTGGRVLPRTWNGWPVIDGDVHDQRFLDPPGVVVGLKLKGPYRRELVGTPFVLPGVLPGEDGPDGGGDGPGGGGGRRRPARRAGAAGSRRRVGEAGGRSRQGGGRGRSRAGAAGGRSRRATVTDSGGGR